MTDASVARAVDRISTGLLYLSAAVLFAMMAVTVIDVVGRSAFDRPLPGSTDLVSLGLSLTLGLALPAVTWHGQHIAIELFKGDSIRPTERLRRGVVGLVSAATFLGLAWVLFRHGQRAARHEDVIGYLQLPVAPMVWALAATAAAAGLVFAAAAFGIVRGGSHLPAEAEETP